MDWNLLFSSYANVFLDPTVLLMTLLGAVGGVLLGAIPGMTATMGVALLIPFSFGMDLIPSVGLLLGIYCGGMYGGSISAILIHAPGTPSAAATLLDGYPMAQKGEAGKALSVAMFSSFCGGVIGALIMTFLSPLVAKVAMKFTSAEMLMLAVFGLSVIISISGKSISKGLISAFFGMLLCTIGLDPTYSKQRFTFGITSLKGGLSFIPVLIGLFAVAEVIAGVERIIAGRESAQAKSTEKITRVLPDGKTIKQIWPNILSGGIIGTFIGAIPGAGGDIAVFVSYAFNKGTSKHPEKWGTGIPNGVASTESANNGCSGGAMIPLLSLGVPGDSVTAILLGAFIIEGHPARTHDVCVRASHRVSGLRGADAGKPCDADRRVRGRARLCQDRVARKAHALSHHSGGVAARRVLHQQERVRRGRVRCLRRDRLAHEQV